MLYHIIHNVIPLFLTVYDYRYYYDLEILFNLLIPWITKDVRIRYPCPNTDSCVIIRTSYIPLDKLYIIDE